MANPVSIQRLLYVLLYFLGAAAAVPVAVAATVVCVGGWVLVMAKKGMPVLSKLLANAQEKNG